MKIVLYRRTVLSIIVLFSSVIHTSHAAMVTSLTLEDVGSGLPGEYSPVLDGFSGAFRFSQINDVTFLGASLFDGDVAANPGPALGEIDVSQANPIQTFTSGFLFATLPFIPSTTGPIVADITVTGGVPTMTIDSLPFAGEFGEPGSGQEFLLGSQTSNHQDCIDNGTHWDPLSVHWLEQIDATHFKYKIGWSHCINSDERDTFVGLSATWRLEGIATIASDTMPEVPLPAVVWLFLSGLMGIIGVARSHKGTIVG